MNISIFKNLTLCSLIVFLTLCGCEDRNKSHQITVGSSGGKFKLENNFFLEIPFNATTNASITTQKPSKDIVPFPLKMNPKEGNLLLALSIPEARIGPVYTFTVTAKDFVRPMLLSLKDESITTSDQSTLTFGFVLKNGKVTNLWGFGVDGSIKNHPFDLRYFRQVYNEQTVTTVTIFLVSVLESVYKKACEQKGDKYWGGNCS